MDTTKNTPLLERPLPLRDQKWDSTVNPRVAVVCITYNHQNFIRQCLDGILGQITNFPVEVIVHDDASDDQTAEIIREYALRYPDIIKPVLQEKNQHSQGKMILAGVFPFCKAKYIAVCEGDDYWILDSKLQQQADYLDLHMECAYCATRFLHVFDDTPAIPFPSREEIELGKLEDILVRNYTHTCTLMFRRELAIFPLDAKLIHSEDWYLCCLLARHGKIAFINEVMSAYRIHGGGVSSGMALEEKYRKIKASLDEIHRMLGGAYLSLRLRALFNYRLLFAYLYFSRKRRWDWHKGFGHVVAAYASYPASAHRSADMQARLRDLYAPFGKAVRAILLKLGRIRFHLGALRRAMGLGPFRRNGH